jgi:hypothetical protein
LPDFPELSIGKTALLERDAFHNETIASFQVEDDALRAYLMWALPALVTHASINPAIMDGTLNSKSIAVLWVPVPPTQEQGRIIAVLKWGTDYSTQSPIPRKPCAESRRRPSRRNPESGVVRRPQTPVFERPPEKRSGSGIGSRYQGLMKPFQRGSMSMTICARSPEMSSLKPKVTGSNPVGRTFRRAKYDNELARLALWVAMEVAIRIFLRFRPIS